MWRALPLLLLSACGGSAALDAPARDPAAAALDADPCADLVVTPGTGTLLLSDSPETPRRSGVLMSGHATGKARLFAYHVNGTDHDKKLTIVVDNSGDAAAVLDISRFAVGHGRDPAAVGQSVAHAFLAAHNHAVKSVPAHGRALLLVQSLDGVAVHAGELIHAIVDVTSAVPVRYRVVMLDAATDTVARVDDVAAFPRDVHTRGTFADAADVAASFACPVTGAARVRLGNTSPHGVDELTGDAVVDGGDYGVVTTLALDVTRPHTLALDPRGGAYRGAVGVGARGVVDTRGGPLGALDDGPVTFTSAGGSSLPVDLVVSPR